MEGQDSSFSLQGALSICFLIVLLEPGTLGMPSFYPMSQLCKFCDLELSSCSGTGTCMSNCSITSICMDSNEVCVSIWRKNETCFSIETLCHDPSKPLYGVMLDDYNSSTCVMKDKNTTSGMAQFCSCTDEEECNDKLLFSPSEYMKLTPSTEVKAALIRHVRDVPIKLFLPPILILNTNRIIK
ncbi:TGF-beta receptor type-2-like [Cottoperca gobio]|uniref:TGF-beta receptor type-2 n=1 Tax=Cottoperca gobio TaxID=56716 RepID=A0A6J2PEM9_COTGO|nr:TGF-beta receptor type-2-like [Cottoperca gobio]